MAIVTEWKPADCRALREACGLTQKDFAKELGCTERSIKRYEGPGPIGRGARADLSTLLAQAPDDVKARFVQLREGGDTDMDRRTALRAGAVGVTGIAFATVGMDSAQAADTAELLGARPNARTIQLMQEALWLAMSLDDTNGSPSALGFAEQGLRFADACESRCPAELLPQLNALRAEWTALIGCLAWDSGDDDRAFLAYSKARDLAHEAKNADVAAYALCHLAQLAVSNGTPRVAVDNSASAFTWARQSSDHHLRAYVAMRAAESAAINGLERDCLAYLDTADRELDGQGPLTPKESRAYFVNPGLLLSSRGNCLDVLGHHKRAAELAAQSATMISPELPRDRAFTHLEEARALTQLSEVDGAAKAIGLAAELAATNRSPRLAAEVVSRRHHLSPWTGAGALTSLDEDLVKHGIVKARGIVKA